MKPIKLIVKTKSDIYPIVIGSKLITNLSNILKENSINYSKCLLVIDKKVFKLRLLPSGIVRKGKMSILGNGVVIDPWALRQVPNIMHLQYTNVQILQGGW